MLARTDWSAEDRFRKLRVGRESCSERYGPYMSALDGVYLLYDTVVKDTNRWTVLLICERLM
jgi:hypothetical protein